MAVTIHHVCCAVHYHSILQLTCLLFHRSLLADCSVEVPTAVCLCGTGEAGVLGLVAARQLAGHGVRTQVLHQADPFYKLHGFTGLLRCSSPTRPATRTVWRRSCGCTG